MVSASASADALPRAAIPMAGASLPAPPCRRAAPSLRVALSKSGTPSSAPSSPWGTPLSSGDCALTTAAPDTQHSPWRSEAAASGRMRARTPPPMLLVARSAGRMDGAGAPFFSDTDAEEEGAAFFLSDVASPHVVVPCDEVSDCSSGRTSDPMPPMLLTVNPDGRVGDDGADTDFFSDTHSEADSDIALDTDFCILDFAASQIAAAKETAWRARPSDAPRLSPQRFDTRFGGRAPSNRLEPAGDLFSDDGNSEASTATSTPGVEAADNEIRPRVIAIPAITLAQMRDRLTGREEPMRQSPRDPRTTVMLQRVAYNLDEQGVRCILDERGLSNTYDAVYVPRSAKKNVNLGYGFVNFVDSAQAAMCIQLCSGQKFGEGLPPRMCSADYAKNQGCMHMAKCEAAMLAKKQRRDLGAAASKGT